jgi:hypothetical protein
MDTTARTFATLFQQLGLPSDNQSIEDLLPLTPRLIQRHAWRILAFGRPDRRLLLTKR